MLASTKQGASTYSTAIALAGNYTQWVLDAFDGLIGRRVIEVGVGHGEHASHLEDVDQYLGIDIDPESVLNASRRNPAHRFLVADALSDDLPSVIGGFTPDTVLCFNVLEHIEDHAQALRNLLGLLSPGGHLLLFVPAHPGLYTAMDRMAGHFRRYTRHSCAELVPKEGYSIVLNEYFNPVGGVGWWVNGFLPHKDLDDPSINRQILLFDRYVLPVSRLINPVTRRFFGQSLVMAIRKS